MQEQINIMVSSGCVDAIKNDDADRSDRLNDDLKSSNSLGGLLSSYHKGANISYEIDHSSLDLDNQGVGLFRVDYIVHKYSGCKDKDLDEEHEMTVNVVVNLTTHEATLLGENIPERDPDEF